MTSFIVHAHFYQPPREDPLTGIIPVEIGAAPYSNWNERIYSECYLPNTNQGNFKQISFNIGPTLFSWIDNHHADTSQKIIQQDRMNMKKCGAGNAMAQSYNHTILPLSSRRDKITQVKWGCADFFYRFGRNPKGLWLPETAVDMETLEILVENGLEFTILAPWQSEENVPTDRAYRVELGGNRSLAVFFFNQELSAAISFDPLATMNADFFVQKQLAPLLNQYRELNKLDESLLLIATDGELYGHHQMFRNFFLERLVDGALTGLPIQMTFPEKWLKENHIKQTVTIKENTSWSCHHGLDRWLGLCDCGPGSGEWKKNLWNAYIQLSDELDDLFYNELIPFVENPWILRDRYIYVMLGAMTLDQLISETINKKLSDEQKRRIHKMLESQREKQRMFTSCGWFFNQYDRIEVRNNQAYAKQAVSLVFQATGVDLSKDLVIFDQ